MKERPILFSAPMVRAILSGQKTMTRRVIKPQRAEWGLVVVAKEKIMSCPYGKIGDWLWLRETHHISHAGALTYRADFSADADPFKRETCGEDCSMVGEKWRPSIHMRRAYSRMLLEITEVRVERLQDITEEDALNEGIIKNSNNFFLASDSPEAHHFLRQPHLTAKGAFNTLWESINGPGSWDANPWVWVVCFRRIA